MNECHCRIILRNQLLNTTKAIKNWPTTGFNEHNSVTTYITLVHFSEWPNVASCNVQLSTEIIKNPYIEIPNCALINLSQPQQFCGNKIASRYPRHLIWNVHLLQFVTCLLILHKCFFDFASNIEHQFNCNVQYNGICDQKNGFKFSKIQHILYSSMLFNANECLEF